MSIFARFRGYDLFDLRHSSMTKYRCAPIREEGGAGFAIHNEMEKEEELEQHHLHALYDTYIPHLEIPSTYDSDPRNVEHVVEFIQRAPHLERLKLTLGHEDAVNIKNVQIFLEAAMKNPRISNIIVELQLCYRFKTWAIIRILKIGGAKIKEIHLFDTVNKVRKEHVEQNMGYGEDVEKLWTHIMTMRNLKKLKFKQISMDLLDCLASRLKKKGVLPSLEHISYSDDRQHPYDVYGSLAWGMEDEFPRGIFTLRWVDRILSKLKSRKLKRAALRFPEYLPHDVMRYLLNGISKQKQLEILDLIGIICPVVFAFFHFGPITSQGGQLV